MSELCIYCGCIAIERDHLFNRGLRVRNKNRVGTGNRKVVSACKECNRSLRMIQLTTVQDRAGYLIEYYRKKWKDEWTEERIERINWMQSIANSKPEPLNFKQRFNYKPRKPISKPKRYYYTDFATRKKVKCANPSCKNEFVPRKTTHIYCCQLCGQQMRLQSYLHP